MGQTDPAPKQRLVEYVVDRVLDETNTDTKILVLARQDEEQRHHISLISRSRSMR